MIVRVKGMQDFLDMALFNAVIAQAKKHCALYNFIEIQTPLIESLELYKRSLGVYTEVVSKEMFVIEPRNKESNERICLRPEMTASTVRAFNENGIQNVPWKVFSYGPCFRYERPQKGRYRQFHQINMEIIGVTETAYDIHFIVMLDRFFSSLLGKNKYTLDINFLGCLDDRPLFIEKLGQFLDSSVVKNGLCAQCIERRTSNIMRIFDCKNSACQELYINAPSLIDSLCDCCLSEWTMLQKEFSALSVPYRYRSTLVRGLDYYNKTVFEFSSNNLGSQNAFCGGGRYNQLVQQLGSRHDHPSIGAAIGLDRLLLLLEDRKDSIITDAGLPLFVVIPCDTAQLTDALLITDSLQTEQMRVDIICHGSLKARFSKAGKMCADYVLVIGDAEQRNRSVKIKNMATGQEISVGYNQLVDYIKSLF